MDSVKLTLQWLLEACAGSGDTAALVWHGVLEPVGGPGAPVRPAVYAGAGNGNDSPRRMVGSRWWSRDDEEPTPVVVIDSIASQANRVEAALLAVADAGGLPVVVLDVGDIRLPPHLPRRVTSWEWPHRVADPALLDSLLDGVPVHRTEWGRALLDATVLDAGPLVAWFPQALAFGFWQSHQGSNRSQARAARVWQSEIVGWAPTDVDASSLTTKGDPLYLSAELVKLVADGTDRFAGWVVEDGKPRKKEKLSALGFGPVPGESPALVSCREITRTATLSLAGLRRVCLGEGAAPGAEAAARVVVAALAIHGHGISDTAALRSGCDLVVAGETLTARGNSGGVPMVLGDTAALLAEAVAHARSVGVDMSGWGAEPKVLAPSPTFAGVIAKCWPVPDGDR